ncbi:flagellar basal-body rod protein FlgG [Clostridium folliculivorans]|uniref:Flagellar basal body protein n=1 Tax=Clostridium folliculivorans TaxID=2886038 RepID=A0A9W6D972_9CLOT|nr:flagellar basal-body rod protein FlgG [Clostridium folliculivorans]GKU23596.1 flagellar basal body protein [Clostridium folliculivorans]GKU29712.1 flagellar basal body protein [Clostridium folliculivorans]
MFRVLWNGKSAMLANQEKLDSISNNLANVGTTGYKRVDVSFKDLMQESLDKQGYPVNDKTAYTGTGVRTSSWVRDDSQGQLQETKKSSDLALDGEGYFRVKQADGSVAYSRDGSFKVDTNGNLVDSQGNFLDVEYAAGYNKDTVALQDKISSDNFAIDKQGTITLKDSNKVVGQVPVYTAVGNDAFTSVGDNLYVPKAGAQVVKSTNVDVLQGYVENANVDMGKEFADMIVTQRAFQLGSKAITTADEMWGMINNLKSR